MDVIGPSVDPEERAARVAAPAVLALFAVVAAVLSDRPWPLAVGGAALAVAAGVVLAMRGVAGPVVLPGLALACGGVVLAAVGQPANVGWFAVCVAAGWAALVAGARVAWVLAVPLVLGFAVQWVNGPDDPGWAAWTAGTIFSLVGCAMARRQRELVAELREAQAGLVARTAAEERNRIAHELHDVIGHALTVSVLHVTSARLALDDDPAEAAASLAEAERLAQRSLAEVRAVVGMMKDGAATQPLPGAGDLESLVGSFRRAGARVEWRVAGDPSSLTDAEGLTVYRILQEALTNVTRHAPGAATSASLDLTGPGSRLVVDSDGPAAASVVREGGGLTGMRQRAESLGGSLDVGPVAAPGRGWRVEAVLP